MHLLGQHPELFKAGAVRNPVTNIAAMATTTDIPDWTYVEALGLGAYDFGAARPGRAACVCRRWSSGIGVVVNSGGRPCGKEGYARPNALRQRRGDHRGWAPDVTDREG